MESTDTVARLVRASSLIERSEGTLMAEAERPSRVLLVLSGTVVATWSAPDGRIVHVGLWGPGQFIGLMTLSGGTMTTEVDALTRVTILTWPSQEFRAITDSDLAVSLDLLDRAVFAIQLLSHLIQRRTFTTAASRLAGLLLQYETVIFSRDSPLVARGQLSALAGVTPQMVGRILRKWEGAGIVRRIRGSGLELLDRVALEAEAVIAPA